MERDNQAELSCVAGHKIISYETYTDSLLMQYMHV